MVTGNRRLRSFAAVMLAATAMLLMSVLPASAQYPPGPPPGIVCPPSQTPGGVTPPGLVRVCTLFGSLPGQSCMVDYEFNPVVEVGEFVTGEDRSAEFELVLLPETVGRIVVVTAACFDDDGDVEVLSVSDTFRVAGAADPPVDRGQPVTPGRPLARTGIDAWQLAGIGALLLGAGVVAVRRRDGRSVSAGSETHSGT
jgi:hypothetical protein